MRVAHFLTDVNEANMFLAWCTHTQCALLIDAPVPDPRLISFIQEQNLTLKGIFVTHDHYDHISGVADILKTFSCPVYAGKPEVGGIRSKHVVHGDEIQIGNLKGNVISLPGHTLASIGLVIGTSVFTGDALFAGSIGGVSSETNRAIEIDHIKKNVFVLPDDYLIHTGHGPSSTVYIEKHFNPFFLL